MPADPTDVDEPAPVFPDLRTPRSSTGRCDCPECECRKPTGLGICPDCREFRHFVPPVKAAKSARARAAAAKAKVAVEAAGSTAAKANGAEAADLDQCKAETKAGTRCRQKITLASRSLCKRHQDALLGGERVTSAATGRPFSKPKAAEPKKATAGRAKARSR